jgi:hypothetical protein
MENLKAREHIGDLGIDGNIIKINHRDLRWNVDWTGSL